MKRSTTLPFDIEWRHLLMLAVGSGSLLLILLCAPTEQPASYHNFADNRSFFGIPNFYNVGSNLAFLFVGVAGLKTCLEKPLARLRTAWLVLFAGITLVSVGSAYYHWNPNNDTLVWDRLPMTIGFMGLFVALLGEYIDVRLRVLLGPAVITGLASVLYWHFLGDLRFYVWVQVIPLLTIPIIIILFRSRYSHRFLLLAALGFYLAAKVLEYFDLQVFDATRRVASGHTIKHLLSAFGCLLIVLMLQRREPLEHPTALLS